MDKSNYVARFIYWIGSLINALGQGRQTNPGRDSAKTPKVPGKPNKLRARTLTLIQKDGAARKIDTKRRAATGKVGRIKGIK